MKSVIITAIFAGIFAVAHPSFAMKVLRHDPLADAVYDRCFLFNGVKERYEECLNKIHEDIRREKESIPAYEDVFQVRPGLITQYLNNQLFTGLVCRAPWQPTQDDGCGHNLFLNEGLAKVCWPKDGQRKLRCEIWANERLSNEVHPIYQKWLKSSFNKLKKCKTYQSDDGDEIELCQ